MVKGKKAAYWLWKDGQVAIKDYKNLARTRRGAVRTTEDQLELKLAKDVKNNRKWFFRYVSSKQKCRKDIHRPIA